IQAWQRNRVVALLPDGIDPEQVLEQAGVASGLDFMASAWTTREVPDADWVKLTQAQFGPIHIGERLWIVPSWHRDDPAVASAAAPGAADAIHIELDPGLAFGTGSHPTTHLCLEWLEANLQPGQSVLDYGCGSGILAIAAKLLGAGSTIGVDIDEQAVRATGYNAQVNGSDLRAMLPDALPEGQF